MPDHRKRMHASLLAWYDAEKRDLPWRHTRDPYAIWVSEVMLQQTQVATVLPYYERWLNRFPTVQSLAVADEQDVLSQWQGLGYYRRARLLLQGARYVSEHGVPQREADWRKVPGIGPYTAGALASIAADEPVPLVDGNVERVFARVEACELSGPPLHKAAWQWSTTMAHASRPGDWNQALMELGARICRPVNPECPACPIRNLCMANLEGRQNELPRREKPVATKSIKEIVWIPYHLGSFGLVQAPEGAWWHGMWVFPRADAEEGVAKLRLLTGEGSLEHAGTVHYQVTVHKVSTEVFLLRPNEPSQEIRWVDEEELKLVPVPAPHRRALRLAKLRLGSPTLFSEW